MKTDSELLELAALAAGYEFVRYHAPTQNCNCQLDTTWGGPWAEVKKPEAPLGACRWNPLTDDGDAFRLAVKLMIKFEVHPAYPFVAAFASNIIGRFEEEITDEAADATRRAIVRAAACIGEQK